MYRASPWEECPLAELREEVRTADLDALHSEAISEEEEEDEPTAK